MVFTYIVYFISITVFLSSILLAVRYGSRQKRATRQAAFYTAETVYGDFANF